MIIIYRKILTQEDKIQQYTSSLRLELSSSITITNNQKTLTEEQNKSQELKDDLKILNSKIQRLENVFISVKFEDFHIISKRLNIHVIDLIHDAFTWDSILSRQNLQDEIYKFKNFENDALYSQLIAILGSDRLMNLLDTLEAKVYRKENASSPADVVTVFILLQILHIWYDFPLSDGEMIGSQESSIRRHHYAVNDAAAPDRNELLYSMMEELQQYREELNKIFENDIFRELSTIQSSEGTAQSIVDQDTEEDLISPTFRYNFLYDTPFENAIDEEDVLIDSQRVNLHEDNRTISQTNDCPHESDPFNASLQSLNSFEEDSVRSNIVENQSIPPSPEKEIVIHQSHEAWFHQSKLRGIEKFPAPILQKDQKLKSKKCDLIKRNASGLVVVENLLFSAKKQPKSRMKSLALK